MRHRGYIEGYYGRRLTWSQRREIVSCLRENGQDTYIYAPKEDPFHRKNWREDYQDTWFENYNSFVNESLSSGVRVIPALAPGLSFDYTDKSDHNTLIKKAFSLAYKTEAFALLMDDIPAKLPDKACSHFASLGEAHGKLLQDLSRELKGARILFCPTVYTDDFTDKGILSSGYLRDLSEHIPDECTILWTGPGVVSRTIGADCIQPLKSIFKRNSIVIWDNLYANDYTPQRLFLGPFTGREKDLESLTSGLLLNPTGLVNTDKLLISIARELQDTEGSYKNWESSIAHFEIPDAFYSVSEHLSLPWTKPEICLSSKQRAEDQIKSLDTLIWDWKGDLHDEWYPFLCKVQNDIKLLYGIGISDAWVNKKYGPLVSRSLDTPLD